MLRQLREHDVDAVVELYRIAFGAERPIDAAELRAWIRNPELSPESLRVLELDGRVVGYGDVVIANDVVELETAAPGHWETFLAWAEETARTQGVSQVRAFFPAGHELEGIVAARGYRYWRSAYTMEIDLSEEPPDAPAHPGTCELRTYAPEDADRLREALNAAFAQDPFFHEATTASFREYYVNTRGFDPELWLLAWDGAQIAGFALAFPGRAGDDGLGWIHSLGVLPGWRGRGFGEALLRSAIARLYARGFRRVGLGVDGSNATGAVRLYERVGMRAVRRGDNWLWDAR